MRLIDADVFDAIINDDGTIDEYATETARNAMLIMPTVDAAPVIRCKDCRFLREQYLCINGNNFPAHWCKQWAGIVPESGFCHLAERKEE